MLVRRHNGVSQKVTLRIHQMGSHRTGYPNKLDHTLSERWFGKCTKQLLLCTERGNVLPKIPVEMVYMVQPIHLQRYVRRLQSTH